jgi:hypothetical protein
MMIVVDGCDLSTENPLCMPANDSLQESGHLSQNGGVRRNRKSKALLKMNSCCTAMLANGVSMLTH